MLSSCARNKEWKSNFHNVTISYSEPWVSFEIQDMDSLLYFGIMDTTTGTSYIVKITRDLPFDQLSNQHYYGQVDYAMLVDNDQNRLLSKEDVTFKGEKYNKRGYLMINDEYGNLKLENYVKRTGVYMYSIQVVYPFDQEIPFELQKIIQDSKIKVKLATTVPIRNAG